MELYDTITTILEDPDFKIKVEFLKGMFVPALEILYLSHMRKKPPLKAAC